MVRYVRDIMSSDVISLSPKSKVIDAAKKMASKNISSVIVTVRKKPIGIITERDMIKRVLTPKKDPELLTLEEIMTKDPVCLQPDSTVVQAAKLMKKNGFRRFPVVEKDILVGIITETDILDGLVDTIKHLNWKLVNTRMAMEEFMKQIEQLLG